MVDDADGRRVDGHRCARGFVVPFERTKMGTTDPATKSRSNAFRAELDAATHARLDAFYREHGEARTLRASGLSRTSLQRGLARMPLTRPIREQIVAWADRLDRAHEEYAP